jgi:hypothetical protein
MRPALPTPRSKIAFVVSILLLLLAPILMGARRSGDYLLAIPSKWRPVEYVYYELNTHKEDLDVLFLGASSLQAAIDTAQVKQSVSEVIGRPATVQALFTWGFSLLGPYEFLKETYRAGRKVRLVVIAHPSRDSGPPLGHEGMSHYLWNYAEDQHIVAHEPLDVRANYYTFSVLGLPRYLLGMLRPNARMGWTDDQRELLTTRASSFGVDLTPIGFADSPAGTTPHAAFVEYAPRPLTIDPQSTFYYGAGSNPSFTDADETPGPDVDMLRAIVELGRAHGTRVLFLCLPRLYLPGEYSEKTVNVYNLPKELYQLGFSWVGVPSAKLFEGLSLDEIHLLFRDQWHLNTNGARYYTRTMLPALLRAYRGMDHP